MLIKQTPTSTQKTKCKSKKHEDTDVMCTTVVRSAVLSSNVTCRQLS